MLEITEHELWESPGIARASTIQGFTSHQVAWERVVNMLAENVVQKNLDSAWT